MLQTIREGLWVARPVLAALAAGRVDATTGNGWLAACTVIAVWLLMTAAIIPVDIRAKREQKVADERRKALYRRPARRQA